MSTRADRQPQPARGSVVPLRRPRQPEPLWRELVGQELRRRRHDDGRTLADVAGAAGISVQYLSELERGLKEPSSEVLGAVHEALGLRLADLTESVTRRLRAGGSSAPSGTLCLAA